MCQFKIFSAFATSNISEISKPSDTPKTPCSSKIFPLLKIILTTGLATLGPTTTNTDAMSDPLFDLAEETSSQKSFFRNRFFSFFTSIFHSVFDGTQDLFFDIENRQARRGIAIVELGAFAVLTAKLSKRLSMLEAFCGSTVLEYFILNKMKGNKFFNWDHLTFCIVGCFNFSVIMATKLYQSFRRGKLTYTQVQNIFSQAPEQLQPRSPSAQNLAPCFYPGQLSSLSQTSPTTPLSSMQNQQPVFPTFPAFVLTQPAQQPDDIPRPASLTRRKTMTSLNQQMNVPVNQEKRRQSSFSQSSQNPLTPKQKDSPGITINVTKAKSSDSDIEIHQE